MSGWPSGVRGGAYLLSSGGIGLTAEGGWFCAPCWLCWPARTATAVKAATAHAMQRMRIIVVTKSIHGEASPGIEEYP